MYLCLDHVSERHYEKALTMKVLFYYYQQAESFVIQLYNLFELFDAKALA